MSTWWIDLGAAPVTTSAAVLVPSQDPEPPPGRGPEFGKSSPVALVVILVLFVATVLLVRSMTVRIRRLPPTFGPSGPEATSPVGGPGESRPEAPRPSDDRASNDRAANDRSEEQRPAV